MKLTILPQPVRHVLLVATLLAVTGCSYLTRKHSVPFGTPPPPATPVPGATPPPLTAPEKRLLADAGHIFAYHRRLGALARQNGGSDSVRNLGAVIEGEMAIAADAFKAFAESRQQKAGTEIGGWGHGGSERLRGMRGQTFDRQFYRELAKSGTEASQEFDQASKGGVDAQIMGFAKNWQPVLRNYPREAIKGEKELDAGSRKASRKP